MNATDVTGPCTAVQYGLIMLTGGSRKMESRHDGKPIRRNAELRTVPLLETEPSDSLPQTPNFNGHSPGEPGLTSDRLDFSSCKKTFEHSPDKSLIHKMNRPLDAQAG